MTTAKVAAEKTPNVMARVLHSPHLWIAAVMVAVLVAIHYWDVLPSVWGLSELGSVLGLGLTRHTFERIILLVPVAYASAMLGIGGGTSVLTLVSAAMLPRALFLSPAPREAMFETGGVIFTGFLMVWLFDALQKGKRRLIEVETTQEMLDTQIKRLGRLHTISSEVSQSLELPQVLNVIDKVEQLMGMEAAWLYFWDKEKTELRLAVSSGYGTVVPSTLKKGQGLDGAAAQSQQPVAVASTAGDAASGMRQDGLHSVLTVPLISKGETVGTLGVGTRSAHQFPPDEVDLLRAIADQIGMAVENAGLYERERMAAEALRVSESNYRKLFEDAGDAIFVHDLADNVVAANSAFATLIGRPRESIIGANVSLFLAPSGLTEAGRSAHEKALKGEIAPSFEQEIIRRDGGIVLTQIGTSLITRNEKPWAFQHIARDITETKRNQDNLHFYVQRVSQAQEAERKRIARELHDETAQALVAIIRNLSDMAAGSSPYSLKDVQEQAREVLRGVRQFSQQLRPSILDDLGLVPALKWLTAELTRDYGVAADVEIVGSPRQFAPEAELTLFRIAQEALNNARRHSGASQVSIKMKFNGGKARMTVSDNGRGFDLPGRLGDLARVGKLGLAGMQERAQLLGGVFTIDTAPGKGTTLSVELPLPKDGAGT